MFWRVHQVRGPSFKEPSRRRVEVILTRRGWKRANTKEDDERICCTRNIGKEALNSSGKKFIT